ncbi:hypothetical protein D3C84_704760 [compost metagenome]
MPVVRQHVKRCALIGLPITSNVDLAPVAADVTMYITEAERITGVTFSLYTVLLPILVRQGYRSGYLDFEIELIWHISLNYPPVNICRLRPAGMVPSCVKTAGRPLRRARSEE